MRDPTLILRAEAQASAPLATAKVGGAVVTGHPQFVDGYRLGFAAGRDAAAGWRPMRTAPRDGVRVLLRLRHGLPAHASQFDGVVFVGKWMGPTHLWAFAAPVGMSGFPDHWIEEWAPLPRPGASATREVHAP